MRHDRWRRVDRSYRGRGRRWPGRCRGGARSRGPHASALRARAASDRWKGAGPVDARSLDLGDSLIWRSRRRLVSNRRTPELVEKGLGGGAMSIGCQWPARSPLAHAFKVHSLAIKLGIFGTLAVDTCSAHGRGIQGLSTLRWDHAGSVAISTSTRSPKPHCARDARCILLAVHGGNAPAPPSVPRSQA